MAIRNLIEMFVKKSRVTRIFKIGETVSKNIYDVFRPINFLSFIFGLRVFSIPRGHSRPIISYLYSISCLITNYIIWRYRHNIANYSNHFDRSIEHVLALINFIELILIAIIGLHQSESFKLCIKKMYAIDKTLKALGSSSSYDKIYRKTVMEVIFFTLFLGAAIIVHTLQKLLVNSMAFQTLEAYLSLIQTIYIFMIEFILVIEFCTMVRCIKLEFQRANELLSDINILPVSSIASELIERSVPIDKNKLFDISSSLRRTHSRLQAASQKINRSKKLLRTIRQVHLELRRISKSLSKLYGIQMFFQIVICILANTHILYYFYEKYSERTLKFDEMNLQLFTVILICLQYSLRIFAVNYMCDRATEEAERTNEIIHTFYGKNTDIAIQREVEIFSIQLMQCHTSYSAFGLYNFGCKHICSCIGIIATYVVILLQVHNSLKKGS